MSGVVDVPLTAIESAGVHARGPTADKIALFRSLLKGRDDVYPRRFESMETGRSGLLEHLGICQAVATP